ncbi:unnamed protein product [Schistosoma turkestanicum]|nr:unnamed protein product [Schistosoma turkestanicum]
MQMFIVSLTSIENDWHFTCNRTRRPKRICCGDGNETICCTRGVCLVYESETGLNLSSKIRKVCHKLNKI